ncbi:hypothetical protein L1887_06056 [Cichorium endivia]|nr:hypothetical protein L1887_06056 [Cichorium endivia]
MTLGLWVEHRKSVKGDPQSYVSSNIAGYVNLLEVAKIVDPQPAIVWVSSSSVYGFNTKNPFLKSHRTYENDERTRRTFEEVRIKGWFVVLDAARQVMDPDIEIDCRRRLDAD